MATAAQVKEFISAIAPLIQKYAKEYGYKVASPIIAQACCESAYGTNSLGYKYHNYFGMKCGSSWKGASVNLSTKEEYQPGTLTSIKANFRVYASMEEGVKGYFDFISAKRYANLKDATTPQQYLEFIKADGYATSSKYVNTNMTIVNNYNLIQYDGEVVVETIQPIPQASFKIGKNYTLQYNMNVRKTANGEKKTYLQLTSNGKAHAVKQADGSAVLRKGTVVTCQAVKVLNGATWVKIPSGWVCGIAASGKIYIS